MSSPNSTVGNYRRTIVRRIDSTTEDLEDTYMDLGPQQQKRNTAGKPWTGNTVQNEARHNGAGHGTATADAHTNSSQHTGNPTPVTAAQTASA